MLSLTRNRPQHLLEEEQRVLQVLSPIGPGMPAIEFFVFMRNGELLQAPMKLNLTLK
jgi:hypothetical protein